jgi:hypothetical protein
MKYLFLILLTQTYAFASPNPLLQCLGLEEERYHKAKDIGPFYELNQKMISALIQFSEDTHLNDEVYNTACKTGMESPSLYILEESLYDDEELFYVENSIKENPTLFNIQDNLIKEFKIATPELFLNFLKSVQAQLPNAECLNKKVPEIQELFFTIKHMQSHKSLAQILKESKSVPKIFSQLKNFKVLLKFCSGSQAQKKQ